MQSILWATGSLLILIPIIYLLPLGISLRGKWMIIVISFLAAVIAILAKAVFPIWKTILMILLLLGLIVYFIQKKLNDVLFSSEISSPKEGYTSHLKEVKKPLIRVKQEKEATLLEEIRPLSGSNQIPVAKEPVKVLMENTKKEQAETLLEKNTPIPVGVSENHSSDVEPELLKELDDNRDFIQTINDQANESKGVMKDIQLFANEEGLSEIEELLNQEVTQSNQSSKSISLLKNFEMNMEEQDSSKVAVEPAIDFDHDFEGILFNLDEPKDRITNHDDAQESLPFMTSKSGETRSDTEKAMIEEVTESNDIDIHRVDIPDTDIGPSEHSLEQEMLQTMVSQIKIAGKTMNENEFEKLIREHIHAKLSVHDYYTFAILLIEHYIHTKKIDQLDKLLQETRLKVKGYAILEMEIEYIYSRYCKRQVISL